jgi:hypothetical protein
MNDKWRPQRGERFWTYGKDDDPGDRRVEALHWSDSEHDQKLFEDGRVFRTKEEAEIAMAQYFGSDKSHRPQEGYY